MIAPGDLLQNRYQVLYSLGKGGFSQVFEIEDGGVLKVLKVLNLKSFPPSQHQKAIELFRREVETLNKFHHAGIPQIEPEGYFVLEDNQPPLHCLVMEKISGVNLQQWRQTGGVLSQSQAIEWLKQLISILDHLHQHQFFHRDIKPSNIMLRSNGQLALIDFGAVREVTKTYLVKQQQQETGTAIISAGYTPLEQADGQAVPQSDFFALGRTFVYLFTGKAPLDLPKDSQTGQLLWRDRISKLIKLSPLFMDLIDGLMALLPGQRPQDCEAILQAIHKIECRLFLQKWLPQFLWLDRFGARSKRGDRFPKLELTVLLVASLFSSTAISIWINRHEIAITLNNWGLDAYHAENRTAAQFFYQSALLLNSQEPSAHFNLGELYESTEQTEQARAAYQIATEMELPEAHNNLARLDILEQNYDQALSLLQDGLKLLEFRKDSYSAENFANKRYALLKNLGWAQFGLNQPDEAEKTLQEAIDLRPNQAAAHCLLALSLMLNVKISDASIERDRCFQYASLQNSDDRILSALVRNAFPPSEVQP